MTHIRKTSIIAAAAALGLTAGTALANEPVSYTHLRAHET